MTRWPWWAQVLAVHLLARAVSAAVLMAVAARQVENLWTPASPSYAEYTGLMWDADWYRIIAEQGYPEELPRGADGRVLQNPWAFFPLFPMLAGGLVRLTGGSWQVVAPTLALVLGALAMLLVHRTVALGLERGAADLPPAVVRALPLAAVAVLTTSAASPVLQVGYTESLALLLLAGTLWCLLQHQYLTAVPVVLALGLTRAVALPVTVAVLAHAFARWRDPSFSRGDRVRLAVLAVVAAASGLLWPAITALVTGEPDAYTRTQGAWRGRGEVVPLVPWLDVARWLFGPWGVLALVLVALLAVAVVAVPAAARLGPELRGWTAGYLGYLVLVLEPGTSLVRFLVLAYPAAAVVALVALRSRVPRVALGLVLVAGLAGQVAWVWLLWRLVPPSGWPP